MEPTVAELSTLNGQEQTQTLKECVRHHSVTQSDAPAIYICDRDGYIKFYNNAAVKLWGRVPEIGKDLWCGSWKIFTPDGLPTLFEDCAMAKALQQGISIPGEEIMIERPDGVRLKVIAHPDPIFDPSGHIVGAVNILTQVN